MTKNTSLWVSTNSDNYVLIVLPFSDIKMISKVKSNDFGVLSTSIVLPNAIKIESVTQEV